ncbi:MAG TPA: hypothetical protein VHE36_06070 [Sphingomicrobium sp.]|jgi:hypothetical protein|nr:hypothetical protein [Sphingomicrobium sp.]
MKLRYLMAASAIAACVGLASPAMADTTNTGTSGNVKGGSTSASQSGTAASGGSTAASQGGTVDQNKDNGNNRDNVDVAVTTGDNNLDGFQANGNNRGNSDSSGSDNNSFGNNAVVADQSLSGVVVGHDQKDLVDDVDGYESGDNNIQGNSFAAYAGILNQAWNTGIAANTQAGTNIAASAQVNFSTDQANGSGTNSNN